MKRVRQLALLSGCTHVIGVDEVGTGAWAGPFVVAAAVTTLEWTHPEVTDSKKLSPSKREELVDKVLVPPNVLEVWLVRVEAQQLSKKHSMGPLLSAAKCQVLTWAFQTFDKSVAVVDGTVFRGMERFWQQKRQLTTLPKADQLVPAVSAASIIAKVFRDRVMREYAKQFPGYYFNHNAGYGTAKHQEGLRKLGPCEIHRMGYSAVLKISRRSA